MSLSRFRRERRGTLVYFGICVAVVLLSMLVLYVQDAAAVRSEVVAQQIDADGHPRPLAEIARSVRTLKLITVVIDTRIPVSATDVSWRGTAKASSVVPVRYHYGIDLTSLESQSLSSLGWNVVALQIPRPTRLSTEIFTEQRDGSEISVTGTRFKNRAGVTQLTKALDQARAEADRYQLSPQQLEEVARQTREQVADAVRKLVGPDTTVLVRYAP